MTGYEDGGGDRPSVSVISDIIPPKSFRQVFGERLPDVFGRHLTKPSSFFVPCGLILWISI